MDWFRYSLCHITTIKFLRRNSVYVWLSCNLKLICISISMFIITNWPWTVHADSNVFSSGPVMNIQLSIRLLFDQTANLSNLLWPNRDHRETLIQILNCFESDWWRSMRNSYTQKICWSWKTDNRISPKYPLNCTSMLSWNTKHTTFVTMCLSFRRKWNKNKS